MKKQAIFFDLNGVLLAFSIRDFCKEFFAYKKKWRLIVHFLNPYITFYALKFACTETVVEHAVIKLITKFPILEQHKTYMLRAINCQNLKAGAHELKTLLKRHNIKLFALTNIGEESLHYLQKQHALFFNDFITLYGTEKEDNYLCKPHKDFFLKHLPKAGIEFEHLVFIDDNYQNVQAAKALGVHTFHFKNMLQLQKEIADIL